MPKHKDRTGERHGKLLVLDLITSGEEFDRIRNYSTSAVWLCSCDCGVIKAVTAERLQKGAKSCGCSLKTIDETGNRYGRLVVIEKVAADHPVKLSSKELGAIWRCACDCGNTTLARGTALRYGNTLSCGCWREDAVSIACSSTHPILVCDDELAQSRIASGDHRRPPHSPRVLQ